METLNLNKLVVESQDLIRNIDGLTGSDAFEEIIKIIFTMSRFSKNSLDVSFLRKVYTEEVCLEYDFFIGNSIKLSDLTIEHILNLFSKIDFESDDIKGRLFETYLGRVFTSGLGQFFTPREIVDFIVDFLLKKKLIPENAKIIDPACGSSGILINIENKTNNGVEIVGYDINERLTRVSKMNMVLHKIKNFKIINKSFLTCSDENVYDVCITNPPFGVEEKQKEILKNFIFGHKKKSCDLEILFIEKIFKILKPGGVCGIVLPDGLFNNISSSDVRNYIIKNADIIASVDLPENVFKSSGTGCETGILFFRKKNINETSNVNFEAYKVDYVGYETKTKFAKKINKNDLIDIINGDIKYSIVNELNDSKRIDGKYYLRKFNNLNKPLLRIFENSGKKIHEIYKDQNQIIKYVQYSDIDPVFGIIKSFTELELSDAPSRAKIVVNQGDILIPKLKQSLDKIAIVTKEFDGCVVTNGFKVIKPIDNKSSELIFAIFRNEKIQEQLRDFSSGTIMPSIDDEYFDEIVKTHNDIDESMLETKVKEVFNLIETAKERINNLY